MIIRLSARPALVLSRKMQTRNHRRGWGVVGGEGIDREGERRTRPEKTRVRRREDGFLLSGGLIRRQGVREGKGKWNEWW